MGQLNNRVGRVALMNCDLFWPEVGFASATAERLLHFGDGILGCGFMPPLSDKVTQIPFFLFLISATTSCCLSSNDDRFK